MKRYLLECRYYLRRFDDESVELYAVKYKRAEKKQASSRIKGVSASKAEESLDESKARMANQDESLDESKWSDYTASLHRRSLDAGAGGTMVNLTLKVVPDDAEDDDNTDCYGGSMVEHSRSATHTATHTPTAEHDEYADDGGTLVVRKSKRKSTLDSVRIGALREAAREQDDDEEDEFDGGTMITVRVKHAQDEDVDEVRVSTRRSSSSRRRRRR